MANIDLRTFMKWAFGEELVHRAVDGGGSWNMIASFAALGTVVDTSGHGPMPELSSVHPDAVVASDAVMMLATGGIDLPAGLDLFPDLDDPHGLIAECVATVLARRAMRDEASLNASLIALVISTAVLGREPDWRVDQPKFRIVERSGHPAWFVRQGGTDRMGRAWSIETDGYDAKAGRPRPGAYRKYEMPATFAGRVQDRIDWYLWASAMHRVAEHLQTGLKAHRILPFDADREIWRKSDIGRGTVQALEIAAQ